MNVAEAIAERRTIRGFLDKPVPQELIRQIFEQAQQAPSNCNTQPWRVVVVSGERRARLEKALMAALLSGAKPSPAFKPGEVDHGRACNLEWNQHGDLRAGIELAFHADFPTKVFDQPGGQGQAKSNSAFDTFTTHNALLKSVKDSG